MESNSFGEKEPPKPYTEAEKEEIRRMISEGTPQSWDPDDLPPWEHHLDS